MASAIEIVFAQSIVADPATTGTPGNASLYRRWPVPQAHFQPTVPAEIGLHVAADAEEGLLLSAMTSR